MSADTKVKNEVVFFIDKQQFKADPRPYSVRELLEMAGEDPAETTLARRKGNELERYSNPDELIQIENGTHFVVLHNGPTPVS